MVLGQRLQPTRPAAHEARARPVALNLSLGDDAVVLLASEGAAAPPLALAGAADCGFDVELAHRDLGRLP